MTISRAQSISIVLLLSSCTGLKDQNNALSTSAIKLDSCRVLYNQVAIHSKPYEKEYITGYKIVNIEWPNVVFSKSRFDKSSTVVFPVIDIAKSKSGDVAIDMGHDKNNILYIFWYGRRGANIVDRGLLKFNGTQFFPVCRD